MKTWILVWLLVSPTNEDGTVAWEAGASEHLTEAACNTQLAEEDLSYLLMEREGELQGHTLYCKEVKGKGIY